MIERAEGLGAVGSDGELEALALDQLAQGVGDVGLVLDDQRLRGDGNG